MSNWKYVDPTNAVVFRMTSNGGMESCQASALPPGTVVDPADQPSLSDLKATALKRLDSDVDAIYGAVLGNRSEEYSLAATDAQAYKTAGYTGTVPGSVASWAAAKNWTNTQAADDILATAAQWINAQAAIRATRLARKEQVRAAPTGDDITMALSAWDSFAAYIRNQLGV